MGWWSGNDDNDNDKQNNNFVFNSTMKSSSTTRECKPDPKDNNFQICKYITKEITTINGQRSEDIKEREERIPNSSFYQQQGSFSNHQNPQYNDFENDVGQFFENFTQNMFKNIPSFVFEFQNMNDNIRPPRQQQQQQQQYQQPKISTFTKTTKKDDIYDC